MSSRRTVGAAALLVCLAGTALAADSGLVRFPADYRSWYLDHSSATLAGHTPEGEIGLANVYANASALKGLKSGKYADGAVFVIDRFQFVEDSANKTLTEGARKALVVMQRDQKRYKDTGGWGFEAFKGGDPKQRVVTDGGAHCFTCHAPLADNNYLFTKLHP
ncbi:MAG: cytochrome P460 family protein [Alphaproteobacteria bacterium]